MITSKFTRFSPMLRKMYCDIVFLKSFLEVFSRTTDEFPLLWRLLSLPTSQVTQNFYKGMLYAKCNRGEMLSRLVD